MTIQFCSPAYRINMRSIREFYETKITFTSTRDENVIGPLRDTADCILEQLQNEECSLAHHVRALSILLWLVQNLENTEIHLDRQTRDEVEGCAYALTGEYLRRGSYNVLDVLWAIEWASPTTLEEIAPQLPDSFFENIGAVEDFECPPSFRRLPGVYYLSGVQCPPDVQSPPGVARLASLARAARLQGFARLQGLARLQDLVLLERRLLGTTMFMEIPHHASCARLALGDSPENKH